MYRVACALLMVASLTACAKVNTYCLEEKEANGYDYMFVTDMKTCQQRNDDVEYYDTTAILKNGDLAYVEADGGHSLKHKKKKIKKETKAPSYAPTPTKR